ncbi:MAG: ABC transporter permease [Lachnospiraceae bacterium]|nr:ABC transporter permease [Lachnospiraceae bacterium]
MRQENMRRIISVASLFLMMMVFGLTSSSFFSMNNMMSILRECSINGIIAIGVAFVIITAGIDLSTGAIVGFTSMMCANLLYYYQLPATLIFVIAIAIGTFCGVLNGYVVTRLRVPAFIATLSTQYLFRSLVFAFAIREGGVITNKKITDPGVLIMGGSIDGIYLVTIAFVVLAIVGQIILKKTKLGTYIYATGSNQKSAELSGINAGKVKWIVFIITGFLCGIAAIFEIGRIGSVTTDLGTGLEFEVIAAVVIGGCAFSGGRGDIFGTFIGAIFMAVLQNGILKYNLPTAAQLVIKGIVIVVMIIFDSVYNNIMQKRILQKARELDEAAQAEEVA